MIELEKDAFGKLIYVAKDGSRHAALPVRAFPLTSPEGGISLLSRAGKELAWIAEIGELPERQRQLIEESLHQREFLPEITRIEAIDGASVPNLWHVETDRGSTAFRLKSEDDIRRIDPSMVIISGESGVNFLIRRVSSLDRHSRRLLMRFLS